MVKPHEFGNLLRVCVSLRTKRVRLASVVASTLAEVLEPLRFPFYG